MSEDLNFWKQLEKPIKVLAPMEDVTDICFRKIFLDCGRPDVFFTEFTSVEGLMSRGRDKVIHRLEFDPREHPIVAQIWGLTPEKYSQTATLVKELGFAGIDINMGCPVAKIVKNGACSALIDNPTLAKEIIQATKEGAQGLPVSVKTRVGTKIRKTEEWLGYLLELGLSALTVHARLAKDMSDKPARWEEIKIAVELRNQISADTIIVGNGDVASYDDIYHKHQHYLADGIMIGRAALHNPFIFNKDIKEISVLSKEEKIKLFLKHIQLMSERWGVDSDLGVMKKFSRVYLNHFEGASELRQKLVSLRTHNEAISLLDTELEA